MADNVQRGDIQGRHSDQLFLDMDGDVASNVVYAWFEEHKSGGARKLVRKWPQLQRELRHWAAEESLIGKEIVHTGDLSIKSLAWLIAQMTAEEPEDQTIHSYFSAIAEGE